MHQSLAAVLFPEYRRRVLGLLLLRPEDALHGREVARRTGLPAGTITRELHKLAAAGLLRQEKRGNQQVYSANTASPIYAELASILRKTSGLADVLFNALLPIVEKLRLAFVFGSVAQGRETSGSDVDLMLVGDVKFKEAVTLLHPAQDAVGREVNVQVYSAAEFASKSRSASFMRDLLGKPKIFLVGDEDVVEALSGRPQQT
jgi:predicted nucleotidyltransferase